MQLDRSTPASLPRTLHTRPGLGARAASTRTIEARLFRAESELRVQFTRIAQLQAEVDRLSAAVRNLEVRRPQQAVRLARRFEPCRIHAAHAFEG
jgi:hypothetical protein